MSELKEFTFNQVKGWNLSNAQLKMQIEVELKRAEKLQQSLKEAELLLSKTKEDLASFQQVQLKTFKDIIEEGATPQANEALISALINLRKQNIQLQERIESVKEQTKKTQEVLNKTEHSDAFEKFARVMANLSGQQADIRHTWDSNDVIRIDDVAIERNISYDEAKIIVENSMKEGEAETEDI